MSVNYKRFLFVLVCVGQFQVKADFLVAQNDKEFYRYLERYTLAIVHFNPFIEELNIKPIQKVKEAFTRLGLKERYEEADVAFIGVNLHRIPELATDFDLKLSYLGTSANKPNDIGDDALVLDAIEKELNGLKDEEKGVFILFKDGKPLKEQGEVVKRVGFIEKSEIKDFVENYFGKQIDETLKKLTEQNQLRKRVRIAQPQPKTVTRYITYEQPTAEYEYYPANDYEVSYPNYYYSPYPRYSHRYRRGYYPWNSYYRSPGFGFGVGFGRRWGGSFSNGFGIGFGW